MSKKRKIPKRQWVSKKRKTPNPTSAYADFFKSVTVGGPIDIQGSHDFDWLSRLAADSAISASLVKCTTEEKMMIAAAMPTFIELVRLATKPNKSPPGRAHASRTKPPKPKEAKP